jgi:hypothetical protein
MKRILLVVTALMLMGVQIPAVVGQEATPPPADIEVMKEQARQNNVCAWPVEVAVDALNVAYPDTNAAYFVMPYMLSSGQSLIVDGTYPFARYFSLTTYKGIGVTGQGIDTLDWLGDTGIAPNPGSGNPALDTDASADPAQRQWTVRVTGTIPVDGATPAAAPSGDGNVIAAHPESDTEQLGILVLRIYVPQDPADHTGGVGLPALTLEEADGSTREVAACADEETAAWTDVIRQMVLVNVVAAPALPLPPSADAVPEWVESRVPGIGPNPDNRYLVAPVAWEPGRVVVVRGQAPTFPDTVAGESPTTSTDLRYWSFCTGSNITDPPLAYPTTACVSDFEIPLDADGFYTVVISQPEDRPANATAENGVAWLQGSDPALPDLMALRHMLPSDEYFDQSVWAVPELTPGVAAEVMGPYFPQTTYCDTATFEEGGADACFAAGETATPAG